MENFPAYAKLKFAGYAKARASALQRTQMEDGMVKQARTLSRVLVTRSVVLTFDSYADYSAFIAWYNVNLNRGADWFNRTDPEDGQVKITRIATKLDKETPVRRTLDRWDIAANLESWE
jgi:hypothetical protein